MTLKQITNQHFYGGKLMNGGKAGMLLVKADYCGYCKNFIPMYKQLSNQFSNLHFLYLDKEYIDNYEVKKAIGEVSQFPTILLFNKDGKFIKKFTKERTLDNLSNFIRSSL